MNQTRKIATEHPHESLYRFSFISASLVRKTLTQPQASGTNPNELLKNHLQQRITRKHSLTP